MLAKRADREGTRYHVSYLSWPGSWNEWVPRDRLRWAPRIPRAVALRVDEVNAAWGGHRIDTEDDTELCGFLPSLRGAALPELAQASTTNGSRTSDRASARIDTAAGQAPRAGASSVGAAAMVDPSLRYHPGDAVEIRCLSTMGPSPWLEATVTAVTAQGVKLRGCVVVGAGPGGLVPPKRLRLVEAAPPERDTDEEEAGCCGSWGTHGTQSMVVEDDEDDEDDVVVAGPGATLTSDGNRQRGWNGGDGGARAARGVLAGEGNAQGGCVIS